MRSRSAFRCHLYHMHVANVFAQHGDFESTKHKKHLQPASACFSGFRLLCLAVFAVRRFHSRNALTSFFFWVKSWALPGIGMFCEVSLTSSPSWSAWRARCHGQAWLVTVCHGADAIVCLAVLLHLLHRKYHPHLPGDLQGMCLMLPPTSDELSQEPDEEAPSFLVYSIVLRVRA